MSKLWEKFPVKLIESSLLVQGGAFRMEHEFKDEGPKLRYFFVLNCSPNDDEVILIKTTTTQIDRRTEISGKEFVIQISPDEYQELKALSAVDCTTIDPIDKSSFLRKIEEKKIIPLPALPKPILEKIIHALSKSPKIEQKHKQMILGSDF